MHVLLNNLIKTVRYIAEQSFKSTDVSIVCRLEFGEYMDARKDQRLKI